MLILEIPGRNRLVIENVVFDYNGTLAVDGVMTPDTKDSLAKLAKLVNVYVLTADTHGTARQQCSGLAVHVSTFPGTDAGQQKAAIIKKLGPEKTLSVGNGFNDIVMSRLATLSIGLIGPEGCSGQLLTVCDIVVSSLTDVFDLLLHPTRIKATLRS